MVTAFLQQATGFKASLWPFAPPPKAWSMSAPSPPALGHQSQSSFTSMPLPGVPLALGHLVSPEASKGCTRSPVPPPNSVTVLGPPVDSCPSATAHGPHLLLRPSSHLPRLRDGSHSPQLLRLERGRHATSSLGSVEPRPHLQLIARAPPAQSTLPAHGSLSRPPSRLCSGQRPHTASLTSLPFSCLSP